MYHAESYQNESQKNNNFNLEINKENESSRENNLQPEFWNNHSNAIKWPYTEF